MQNLFSEKKGIDTSDNVSYGGNINQSYFNRFNETDNTLAQGNTASIFMAELQGNYLINPSNNLNLFAGLSYRNITANSSPVLSTGNTTWFSIGIRADLFNWYFDF